MMIKSGWPSSAFSSSFVILGASADKTDVVNTPTIKRMDIMRGNNLLFITVPQWFNDSHPFKKDVDFP
jgi:hypothetical protein